jgi:hypothetical protein
MWYCSVSDLDDLHGRHTWQTEAQYETQCQQGVEGNDSKDRKEAAAAATASQRLGLFTLWKDSYTVIHDGYVIKRKNILYGFHVKLIVSNRLVRVNVTTK